MPVLAPFFGDTVTYGAVVSWGDLYRTGTCAVNLSNGSFISLSPAVFVKATRKGLNLDSNAAFPTIVEETDTSASYIEHLGLSFRQWHQIFFSNVSITGHSHVMTLSVATPTHVSKFTAADCDNDHPSIYVCQLYLRNNGACVQQTTYHVSWDAFQIVKFPASVGSITSFQARYIWSAMQAGGNWNYTVFGVKSMSNGIPTALTAPLNYSFPSIRVYDGFYDFTRVACFSYGYRSVYIGWYDDSGRVHYAIDSNSSYLAPKWSMKQYTVAATDPNLDVRTHDLSAFQNEHSCLQSDAIDVHAVGAGEYLKKDSITSLVFLRTGPKDSAVCLNDNEIWATASVTMPSTPSGTLALRPTVLPADSLLVVAGAVALTDSLHVSVTGTSVQFPYAGWNSDSAGLATWLGSGGHIRVYIDAYSAARGVKLATVDSMSITASTRIGRSGSRNILLNAFVDSTIYFTFRVVTIASYTGETIGALLIQPFDTSSGGMGKQTMRDAGKAGEVPIGSNPIDLLFYPSPAHPNARVMYTVPIEDQVDMTEVRVFTLLGKDVTTLVNDIQPAGRHTVEFDGSNLRSGVYVVAVHTSTHMQSKLIVVQR